MIAYRAMAAMESKSLHDLLDAENHLPKAAREAMLPATLSGAAAARAQIESDPGDAVGYLLLAMHLGFQGVAKGKVSAFLEGIPAGVQRAYRKAIELDERVRAAGPLQVRGRFRTIVPFPYRNLRAAVESLERARSIAPVKQTLFFLGDAYAWQGRVEDARAAWLAALQAAPAEHARMLAPLVDALIEQRLARTASPPR